jgi:alpha-mannosidase
VEYADLSASAWAVVSGPARLRVVESGPARVALEVVRETAGSSFVQTVRLAAGDAGDRVEVENEIDWRTKRTLLKAAFPLASGNEKATYDLGLGTIERGVSTPKLCEVPAQQWADLTAPDGSYGAAILNDGKYGWDHPDAGTLRLTLIHTPGIGSARFRWVGDQASQDLGHHRFVFALVGHAGGWREGAVTWQADRLNQPLLAWQVPRHAGELGRAFSFARVEGSPASESPPAAVRALKMAEESDEVVVRLEELPGRPSEAVRLVMARPIVAAREINAAEQPLATTDPRTEEPARLEDGRLVVGFARYQPRTFAVRLAPAHARVTSPESAPVALPFDLDGITLESATDGDFDGLGHTIASELLPESVTVAGVAFRTGSRGPGQANVLTCRGQRLDLPTGEWNRLYLLAAAVAGDREAVFHAGDATARLWVQDWAEPIGQWDDRLNGGVRHDDPGDIVPAFAKPARLGWLGTHRHDGYGRNEAYVFTQVFLYAIELQRGASFVTLPDDPAVRILAATAVRAKNDEIRPVQTFQDQTRRTAVRIPAPQTVFVDQLKVEVSSPNPHAVVRYTLDGSEPGPGSPVVRGPLTLTTTTTVKARAFAPGLDDRFVAEARFTRLTTKPAATVGNTPPGLRCRYVEGTWRELPDPALLPDAREEVVSEFTVPPFARLEHFALELTGYLRVPLDGLYALSLRYDDVASLELDGETVVNPADSNGGGDDRRLVALAAGLHPIKVRVLHRRLVPLLQLWIEGPGFAMRPVRTDELAHD